MTVLTSNPDKSPQRLRLMDHVGWYVTDVGEEKFAEVVRRLEPLFAEIAKIVAEASGVETEP